MLLTCSKLMTVRMQLACLMLYAGYTIVYLGRATHLAMQSNRVAQ